MAPMRNIRPVNGYVELSSPQVLDDKWVELRFDLLAGLNVLLDVVVPESAGGYVYRDAHQVTSPCHNRFLYWRIANDALELVELSSEAVLEGNQVRIRFAGSPVINAVNVIEFSESVVIVVATLTSVHRLHLPHPKATDRSILNELSNEVLYNTANYYVFNNHGTSDAQQPICATSWCDKSMLKCALTFPDSSILIVQFSRTTFHVSTCEIRQVGIIGRLWSRMPNLLAKNPNDCDNAIFSCAAYNHLDDVLLFAFCRDCKIRVFSTNTRECVLTHNMIPQSSFSQSFASHTNPTTEQPMMKMFGSQLIIYLTEGKPEFVMLDYSFDEGIHALTERLTVSAFNWEKLIDFSLTESKIWALATIRETETALCYFDFRDSDNSEPVSIWDFVNLDGDSDTPSVKNYNAEIFWRNRFSLNTVQKALACIAGPSVPKKNDMKGLEEVAFTRIVDGDQEEAWAKFYDYCLQNHMASNRNIGLVVSSNESVITIIKRVNPSFVCPWPMSVDMILQGGPYRGIEFSTSLRSLIGALNYISTELVDEESSSELELRLMEDPSQVPIFLKNFINTAIQGEKVDFSKLSFNQKHLIATGIDFICEQLDLTAQSNEYALKVLQEISAPIRSDRNPLGSNSGIITTYELFRRLVRARMTLSRDLLIYIALTKSFSESDSTSATGKFLANLVEDVYTSGKLRRITDCYRSYGILVWISDSPIKVQPSHANKEVVDCLAEKFRFFRRSIDINELTNESILEANLRQNLLTNFLLDGGTSFASTTDQLSDQPQTLSSSFYVTEISLNICKILWPKTEHNCFAEFLFTRHLDEHLDEYLVLMDEWLEDISYDRHFIRAANCLLRDSPIRAVEIFNRLWMHMTYSNLIGRFIGLDQEKKESQTSDRLVVKPSTIYRYYDKVLVLFQSYNSPQSLISLINRCMSLLDEKDEEQSRWVNRFRAELFQYHLQLEETDEAYHTMVLTTDPSLRINCLRKFIVCHCEKEQWSNLLSYPFIDIKSDFIDILTLKAENSDLSKLNNEDFYRTSYYDLLFASYVSDDEFGKAAGVMYNYAQRLAQEVPSIISIRKQTDCLLIALNSLRCVEDSNAFIDHGCPPIREDGRSSVMKRAYDSEPNATTHSEFANQDTTSLLLATTRIDRKEIEMKYELTKARLRLLEKDQTANAIALSPLKPEEIIMQQVNSSMFAEAMDLSLLFKTPMDPILEGLTAKYIFVMGLSSIDFAIHQDVERAITEVFTSSYSNISTYNYIANSSSSFVEKLWRFIDHFLTTFDGISHRYSNDDLKNTFSGSTVLMRIVASKLLSAGCDIPASLRRMYLARNVAELLKLLIKYDKLIDAAELVVEMVDRVLEPVKCFAFASPFTTKDPPPIYLPTHLIILLITFLKEDVTNTQMAKAGDVLMDKLNRYRCFIKSV